MDGTFNRKEYVEEKGRLEEKERALKLSIAGLKKELEPDPYELEGLEQSISELGQALSRHPENGDVKIEKFYDWDDWMYFVNLVNLMVQITGSKVRLTAGIHQEFLLF